MTSCGEDYAVLTLLVLLGCMSNYYDREGESMVLADKCILAMDPQNLYSNIMKQ